MPLNNALCVCVNCLGLSVSKVDKVTADMATTRQRQAELTERMTKLAAESADIKSLSDQLRDKLSVLELERTAAYTGELFWVLLHWLSVVVGGGWVGVVGPTLVVFFF